MSPVLIIYSEEFRKRVAEEVLTGKITMAEAARKYHIGGHVTVGRWVKNYRNCGYTVKGEAATMKKKYREDTPDGRLAAAERELGLYKQLIEVSDYFKDPAVKKKIAERLLNIYGGKMEELETIDIPWLKSVLYSVSAGRHTTKSDDAIIDESSRKESSLNGLEECGK